MSSLYKRFYEFGGFRLNADDRVLLRSDEVVKLMPKTVETLCILVANHGQVVGKEELVRQLWPDVIVEENNLPQHISALRKALGQDNNGNRFIETVPKRGYRFVAEVREAAADEAVVAPLSEPEPLAEHEPAQNIATPEAARQHVRSRSAPARRQQLLVSVGLVLVTGVALAFVIRSVRQPSRAGIEQIKSVAVLPFKSLPEEEGDEERRLGIGIADNLINRLGRSSQLIVRPVRAVSGYADTQQDPLRLGRQLRVEAVLDGSVQQDGERLRVTAQLLRVSDGSMLWADKFDGQEADIFAAQDWIATRVAGSLMLELTSQQRKRLAKRYTENTEAWQAYVKGRYFWNQRNVPAFRKVIEHFEQAVARDPQYALAYSGLADAWLLLGVFSDIPPQEAAAKAKSAALRALALDEEIAEAHASLGVIKAWYEWDWAGAETGLRRALELNPSYATAHQWYGLILTNLGRNDEAIAELKRAQELDPLSLIINADLALVYAFAGQYEPALVLFNQTLEMDADFNYARLERARVYVRQGRYEEALSDFTRLIERHGRALDPLVDIGYTYALMGRTEDARQILAELLARARREFVPPMMLAVLYAALGEKNRAFQMLEQEYAQRSDRMTNLRTNYLLTPLHADPRFTDLLRRVGLEKK